MLDSAKDIIVKIKGDSKQFTDETNKATKSVDNLEDGVDDLGKKSEKTEKKTGKFANTLKKGLAVAAAAAAAALGKAVIAAGNLAKKLDHLHYKLGISVEDLDDLKYAVSKTGVEFDDFTEALKDLSIKAGEAAQGNEGVMKTFNDLGVSIYRTDGQLKNTETLFYEVAQAISNIKDPALQAAYANQLMADNGYKVLPILKDIKGFVNDTNYAKVHDMGVTQDEIEKLERYNQLMGELGFTLDGLKVDVVANILSPVAESFAINNQVEELFKKLQELNKIENRTFEEDQQRNRILFELRHGNYESMKDTLREIDKIEEEIIEKEENLYFIQLRKMGASEEYIQSLKDELNIKKEQLGVEKEITAEIYKQSEAMRARKAGIDLGSLSDSGKTRKSGEHEIISAGASKFFLAKQRFNAESSVISGAE